MNIMHRMINELFSNYLNYIHIMIIIKSKNIDFYILVIKYFYLFFI